MSKAEDKIERLIRLAHLTYSREKIFPDLKGFKGAPLRYDFCIYQEGAILCLIEFQGMQHYKFTKSFFKTQSEFKLYQEYDRRKISYALAHSIPLYIIPAWEEKNFNDSFDLLQPKFLAASRWHNDQVYRQYLKSIENS